MLPGSDCLACHGDGGGARRWTVAGTIYQEPSTSGDTAVSGANVRITDATGWSFALRTNRAGNFYTAERVVFPLSVCVERLGVSRCMSEPVGLGEGSCNVCHGPEGALRPENHERFFPIVSGAAHESVKCGECHSRYSGAHPVDFRCGECHAGLDPDLATTHTTTTSNPAIVVSEFALTSDACLRCHADAQVVPTSLHPTGAEGLPPHEQAACTTCHDTYRVDKPFGADFATSPRSWPPGSGHGCASCHESGPPGG